MEVIGARTADHVDLPPGDAAIFRRQDALTICTSEIQLRLMTEI